MNLSVTVRGCQHTVALCGEIDAANVHILRSRWLRQLAGNYRLLIDTAGLEYISVDGFWALCELDLISRGANLGGIVIVQPSYAIRQIRDTIARIRPQAILPAIS